MYTCACGDVYDGEWKDDARSGQGVLRYASGAVYTGSWSRDLRVGHGSLVFEDGSSFVGQWVDDSYGEGNFCSKQGVIDGNEMARDV